VRPLLPFWLNRLSLFRVRVGDGAVDLVLTRGRDGVQLDVRNAGNLRVIEEKVPEGVEEMATERR
jgi:hypothetical protein